MPSTQTTKNLFLQISADAGGVARAAKAARISLAEIGSDASNMQQAVAEAFQKLGGSDVQQSARQMEGAFRRTLQSIRANAQQTLEQPLNAAGIVNINVNAAAQQLAGAQASAEAYRQLADAQTQVVATTPNASAGARQLAVALEAQALAAREDVASIEQQVATLRQLQGALGVTADAEDEVVAAHGRMGASGLILDHVVRSFTDSVAAGQSPLRAFAMEVPRLGEAMQFMSLQAGNSEGAMGKLAGFMSGGWGIAVTAAISVAGTLVNTLLDQSDAADQDAKAHDALKDAVDRLYNAQANLNHETRQGIIDDINAANAMRLHEVQARGLLDAKLKLAQSDLQGSSPYQVGGMGVTVGDPSRGAAAASAQSISKQIADNQAAIQKANVAIIQGAGQLLRRDIESATNPRAAITHRYEDRADILQRAYEAGKITPQAYRDQLSVITEQRDSGLKDLTKRTRAPRADRTAERAANADRAFQDQLRQAQDAYSQAQLGLADTAEQRYAIAIDRLRADLSQRDAAIADQVKAGKLSSAQALQLEAVLGSTEQLNEEKAKREQINAILDRQLATQNASLNAQIDLLRAKGQGSTSRGESYQYAQLELNAQQAIRRNNLSRTLAFGSDASDQQKADALAQTQTLPALETQERRNLGQQYASPLDKYRQQLQSSVGGIGDDLQTLQVDAITHLGDGLESAATKALKLHGVLGQITSDLIKMAIEREFELPIANALLGGATGGAGGGILSAIGSLFGGGRAVGGGVSHGKYYMVGENGPELFAPGMSGTIIPNDNLPVPQMATLTSADMKAIYQPAGATQIVVKTEEGALFRPVVHSISGQHAAVAQENGATDGANRAAEKMAWMRNRKLGGTR